MRSWRGSHRSVRGAAVGLVLAVAAIAMLMAFTLAGIAFSNVNLQMTSANRNVARDLAESALSLTMQRIVASDGAFGRHAETILLSRDGGGARPDGADALVVFAPVQTALTDYTTSASVGGAPSVTVPLSVDNFDPTAAAQAPVPGFQRAVPSDAYHLIATAVCGGQTCRVEELLSFPPFSFAIASAGTLHTVNIQVTGVGTPTDLQYTAGGTVDLAHSKLTQGNVVSNNAGANAVVLDTATQVDGDAQAVGDIQVAVDARVTGEVRPHYNTMSIPLITNIDLYNPEHTEVCQELTGSIGDPSVETSLAGLVHAAGNLVIKGDVRLDNCVLFVEQNLEIDGGLHGVGAVFVKGTTLMKGSVHLETDDQAALVSMGDIQLTGDDRNTKFFQGMVYTAGNLIAARMTLVGAFIQQNSAAITDMQDVSVIHSGMAANLSVFQSRSFKMNGGGALSGPAASPDPATVEYIVDPPTNGSDAYTDILHDRQAFQVNVRQNAVTGGSDYIFTVYDHGRGDGSGGYPGLYFFPPEDVTDRVLLPGSPWNADPRMDQNTPLQGATQFFPGNVFNLMSVREYSPTLTSPQYQAAMQAYNQAEQAVTALPTPSPLPNGSPAPTPDLTALAQAQLTSAQQALLQIKDLKVRQCIAQICADQALHIAYINAKLGKNYTLQDFINSFLQAFTVADGQTPRDQIAHVNFHYDPNQFISLSERARILLWADLQ